MNGLELRTHRNAISSVATDASTALPMIAIGIHHQLPPCRKKKYDVYAPTVISSPWAKLTRCITPKISEIPSARSAYVLPTPNPSTIV